MNEFNIAKIIVTKRKEKRVTQDNLANYVGVSKASVSKWETGQNYPDITFLPQLAAYFNISIDDLMGYEPQMTKKDIRKLYHKLSIDFNTLPFNEVLNHCRSIIKKYFSCFPLLFQIGTLFLNYNMISKDTDKTTVIILEAKELFIRVKNESNDAELVKQALNMEAMCLLSLGNPNEVLELLDGSNILLTSTEILLASAYQMINKTDKAKKVLQVGLYQYMMGLIGILNSYISLYVDDLKSFNEIYSRTIAIIKAFNIKKLHPTIFLTFSLIAAQGFLTYKNTDKTLEILEEYADIVTGDIYPLKLHGDNFFNLLDDWFNDMSLGTSPPRDEKSIKKSMIDALVDNSAFSELIDEARFQKIIKRIKITVQEE